MREKSRAAFAFLGKKENMRTIVYVDGFNLYHRLLEKNPAVRWLDLKSLSQRLLDPTNNIIGIKYYTARVSGALNPATPGRQQVYLDALGTIPEISIHFGSFIVSEKWAGLITPPKFLPKLPPGVVMPQPWPDVVKVRKIEEKGSDVNLACHLLLDAFLNNYDVAVVISNDSDLVEPIRIVRHILGKPVGLFSPVPNPTPTLQGVASFIRRIRHGDLTHSQFPDPVIDPNGTAIQKPVTWV